MINDIKIAIKLLKYGLNLKTNSISGIIFFILGVIGIFMMPFSGGHDISALSGFYITLSGLYFGQFLMTTTISHLVQSSPYKKKLQTSVLMIFTTIITATLFTIFILLVMLTTVLFPEQYADPDVLSHISTVILITGIVSFFFLIYISISFKKYLVSYIIMLVLIVPLMLVVMNDSLVRISGLNALSGNLSLGSAAAIGYLLIAIGAVIGYLLSLAVYRVDISPATYKNVLKQTH